ncbi:hypothetical protein [Aquihabitans sp. McL0605]|uniref:hypothetical protein n=1 Tax=Aquihabitans sp. McL0605 TaxID=3415671 RepID=UPI003CECE626
MRITAVPAVLLATSLALGLASCSTGSSEAKAAPTTTRAAASTTKAAASPKEEYCAIEAQIDALLGPAFAAGNPAAIVAASVKIEPLLPKAQAAAPDEIADAVATLVPAMQAAAKGDAGALRTQEIGQASGQVDDYCGPPAGQ